MITRSCELLTRLLLAPADSRIYACVRIGFAFAALVNLILLWPDRACLLTEAGMIDQELTRQTYLWPYLTVFDWCRDDTSVSIVLLVAAAAMILLLVGKYQRVAALLVYVWHVSYSARAVTALTGWDSVLRSISFLVLLAPLPAVWALDKSRERTPVVKIYGLTLMRFQLLVIYWQTVLDRHDSEFWLSGEFMGYYVLSAERTLACDLAGGLRHDVTGCDLSYPHSRSGATAAADESALAPGRDAYGSAVPFRHLCDISQPADVFLGHDGVVPRLSAFRRHRLAVATGQVLAANSEASSLTRHTSPLPMPHRERQPGRSGEFHHRRRDQQPSWDSRVYAAGRVSRAVGCLFGGGADTALFIPASLHS